MFLDLGKLCNQLLCVAPFIISKLPCSSTSDTVCLVCLCLNENFRSAPKLNEKIVLFFPSGFSIDNIIDNDEIKEMLVSKNIGNKFTSTIFGIQLTNTH